MTLVEPIVTCKFAIQKLSMEFPISNDYLRHALFLNRLIIKVVSSLNSSRDLGFFKDSISFAFSFIPLAAHFLQFCFYKLSLKLHSCFYSVSFFTVTLQLSCGSSLFAHPSLGQQVACSITKPFLGITVEQTFSCP